MHRFGRNHRGWRLFPGRDIGFSLLKYIKLHSAGMIEVGGYLLDEISAVPCSLIQVVPRFRRPKGSIGPGQVALFLVQRSEAIPGLDADCS